MTFSIEIPETAPAPRKSYRPAPAGDRRDLFGAALEVSADMIYVKDPGSCRLLEVNATICAELGYTRSELLALNVQDVLAGRGAETLRDQLARLLAAQPAASTRSAVFRRKDGTEFPVEIHSRAVRFGSEPVVVSIAREITDMVRSEEPLTSQAELLDLAMDAIIIRDRDDRVTCWNHGAEALYGWTRAEALNRCTHSLFATEFPTQYDEVRAKLLDSGQWLGKLVHRTRDGSPVVVESRWTLRRAGDGRPAATLEINRDVTERERTAEALCRSEERFNKIFRSSPVAMNIGNPDTARIIDCNERYLEVFGYSREEMIGKSGEGLRLWADPAERAKTLRQLQTAGSVRNVEVRFRRKSGEIGDALFCSERIDFRGEPVQVTMRIDITERKLHESLLSLQSAAAVAISRAPDFRTGLEAVIRLTCELTGWAVGEAWLPDAAGKRLAWSGACHSSIDGIDDYLRASTPRTFARGERFIGAVWANCRPTWNDLPSKVDLRRVNLIPGGVQAHCAIPVVADSEVVAILSFLSPAQRPRDQRLLDAISGIAAQLGMLLEGKRTEEALRRSEERFALFARHMDGAFFIKDVQGRYVFANPVTEAALGVAPGAWKNRTDEELLPPETANALMENDSRVLRSRQPIQTIETVGRSDPRHWLVNKFPIPGGLDAPPLLGGTAFDITELKRTEAALRRALDEKGRLYADLHDNTVQTIYGIGMELEECRKLLQESPRLLHARLGHAVAGLNRVMRDIRGYIAGSAPKTLNARRFRATLARLARTTGAGTGLRFEVSVDPGAVALLSPDQGRDIMCIATEALSNALRHSRAQRGTLTLSASAAAVSLEVGDHGVGFEADVPRRAGGGLRNMARRVRRMGGRLRIVTRPGQGTRVLVRIPRESPGKGAPPPNSPASSQDQPLVQRSRRPRYGDGAA